MKDFLAVCFNVLTWVSRPKDGVASLAYVPAIHVFLHCTAKRDARDKRRA